MDSVKRIAYRNMKLNSYKELIVWQRAMELAEEIFRLTSLFPKSELYGVISQMRRATISIPSNIAEGYGRKSTNEFKQFLSVSYGSALELETQLLLTQKLKFAPDLQFNKSFSLLVEVVKMLYSMNVKLNTKRYTLNAI